MPMGRICWRNTARLSWNKTIKPKPIMQNHAAVGDDLQAVEGNVGCNGNCTGLVGCGLLQI